MKMGSAEKIIPIRRRKIMAVMEKTKQQRAQGWGPEDRGTETNEESSGGMG